MRLSTCSNKKVYGWQITSHEIFFDHFIRYSFSFFKVFSHFLKSTLHIIVTAISQKEIQEMLLIVFCRIDATKNYKKHFLNFLLAYSGDDDMQSAFQKVAENLKKGERVTNE